MISGWELWLVLVGLALGGAVVFVALVRLQRAEDDVGTAERRAEAAWIADIIERHGGVAPVSLVDEVLDLHAAYLRTARVPLPPGATAPPLPPPGRPPTSGMAPPPSVPPPGSPPSAFLPPGR